MQNVIEVILCPSSGEFIKLKGIERAIQLADSCRSRVPASRPEAVSQAFSGSGTRLFSSEERRFFRALRYLVSSYGVRLFQQR